LPEPDDLCCFGAGGHGRVVASQWRARRGGDVTFADERLAVGSAVGSSFVRFGALEDIEDCAVLITVGDNDTRSRLQTRAERAGLPLAIFIADEDAYFAPPPGVGSMILAGAVVNSDARIGRGAIVNSGAIVEHDCEIGDFVHVSPGACIAGASVIGERVWVGANATVIPQLVIAPGTVIGAGSTVIRSIAEPGVYAGSPARRIR
jgi:sugar O-acyltransferase (sialic acid O-acetyltransferase NeuD family)